MSNLFIEYQKHYAAFIEHTDAQIGRLIKAILSSL